MIYYLDHYLLYFIYISRTFRASTDVNLWALLLASKLMSFLPQLVSVNERYKNIAWVCIVTWAEKKY